MAQQNVETGYIKPVASTDTFAVNTAKVEEWLQRQINATAAVARKNGDDVPAVNVTLFTLQASNKFFPFVIVLPEEALIKRGGRKGGNHNEDSEEEMDIFNPSDSQNYTKFWPHIWKVVQSYKYNKEDKDALRSTEMRNALHLSVSTSNYLTSVFNPRIERNGGSRVAMMLLDPLRVFFAMAREASREPGSTFQIEILKTELNQGTDFIYTFNKVPKDPKRKKTKDLANEINKMMLNATRR